jgi:hypothetical protein
MKRLDVIRLEILMTSDTDLIQANVAESDKIFESLNYNIQNMFESFSIIQWLCYLNLTFLLQHMVTFIFTSKLKRFYQFPTLLHLSDTVLFVCSIIIINWISGTLMLNIYDDMTLDNRVIGMKMMNNLRDNIDFNLQYFFSIQIVCLMLRLAMIF